MDQRLQDVIERIIKINELRKSIDNIVVKLIESTGKTRREFEPLFINYQKERYFDALQTRCESTTGKTQQEAS